MRDDNGPVLKCVSGHERLCLEALREDSIRVRAGQLGIVEDRPGALITPSPAPSAGATGPLDHSRQRQTEGRDFATRAGELLLLRQRHGATVGTEGSFHIRPPLRLGQNGGPGPDGEYSRSYFGQLPPYRDPCRERPVGPGCPAGSSRRRSSCSSGFERRRFR
jgi:hypothetical protein